MNISRNLTNTIRFILDECIPPIIRDQKWFVWLPFKLLFKEKVDTFIKFKTDFPHLSQKEIYEVYLMTGDVHMSRETDINKECLMRIENDICGKNVLDVGCGSGHLVGILEKDYKVTGLDFIKSENYKPPYVKSEHVVSNIDTLPFKDKSFDTVICAHTLEHVSNINQSILELRRVCRKRLIIIVPRQRPYRYSFDLHVHFFPYKHTFLNLIKNIGDKPLKASIEEIKGDIYYIESFDELSNE